MGWSVELTQLSDPDVSVSFGPSQTASRKGSEVTEPGTRAPLRRSYPPARTFLEALPYLSSFYFLFSSILYYFWNSNKDRIKGQYSDAVVIGLIL